jgi:hypothetical protein
MTRANRFAGWTLVVVAALGVWGALRLPLGRPGSPEAGFVPLIEAILLGLTGLTLGCQRDRNPADPVPDWPRGDAKRMILKLLIALAGYILLMPIIGYSLATFLFLSVAIWAWRRYSLLVSLAYALAVTLVIQFTFSVALGMPLPRGAFGF